MRNEHVTEKNGHHPHNRFHDPPTSGVAANYGLQFWNSG